MYSIYAIFAIQTPMVLLRATIQTILTSVVRHDSLFDILNRLRQVETASQLASICQSYLQCGGGLRLIDACRSLLGRSSLAG